MVTYPYIELLTHNLHLSPLAPSDMPELQAIWADPLVARFLPGGEPYPPEAARVELDNMRAHWQTHNLGIFAVRRRGQKKTAGLLWHSETARRPRRRFRRGFTALGERVRDLVRPESGCLGTRYCQRSCPRLPALCFRSCRAEASGRRYSPG